MIPSNRLFTVVSLAALVALAACAAPSVQEATSVPSTSPSQVPAAVPDPASPPEVPSVTNEPAAEPEPAGTAGPLVGVELHAARSGDVVTVPLAAVVDVRNAAFGLTVDDRRMDFMAYVLDGELFVRAGACPPCDSTAFVLDGEELVCDACGTRFDGWTGAGIDGACVDYPKAAVAYQLNEDMVAMTVADLVDAWDETADGSGARDEIAEVGQPEPAPEEEDSRPSCCR